MLTTAVDLEKKFRAFSCQFMAGVPIKGEVPIEDLPEITFVGRSNVGKSSLINSLFMRKKLARISKTPGCTQQINFFRIANKFNLVDVPGYGFAKVSKELLIEWSPLLTQYLKNRTTLKHVYILIDSRHSSKKSDEIMINFLNEVSIPYSLILTKIDKVSDSLLEISSKKLEDLIKLSHIGPIPIFKTSVRHTNSINLLRQSIWDLLCREA